MNRLGLVIRRSAGKRKDHVRFSVNRLGLVVVRHSAGKRKDAGSVSPLGLSGGKAGKRKDTWFDSP